MDVELTRVSEKGQVVIPSSLRDSLRIKKSDKFLVFGDENTIVLKRVEQSVLEKSFDEIARPLRKAAKKLGLTRADLVKATAQHA